MNANEPAFPQEREEGINTIGLTKRDYFAAMAMQGLVANKSVYETACFGSTESLSAGQIIAPAALRIADALLAELERSAK